MEKKLLISNAPLYNGNRGCVALTYSIMYLLYQEARSNGIELTFFLSNSGNAAKENGSISIGDVEIPFLNIEPLSFDIRDLIKLVFKPHRLLQSIKAYRSVDYMLDIGQGDSFADIYGVRRFNLIFKSHQIAHFLKKKFCILPQTIGPFKAPLIKKKANRSINQSDLVFVRDRQSFDYVLANTQQKNVFEITDVAFFMPFVKKDFSKDFTHVGLNISALLWHGGYTKNNQFGLTVDYPILIKKIIDYFLTMDNVRVHLIPHVVNSEYSIENDYAVSFQISEEYNNPNIILAPLFLTPIIAKNYIAGMDFFMGARMHATIAAFSSEVPVYPMAYSRKFNGLFMDTLDYKYMGDMLTQSVDEIMHGIKKSFEQRTFLKELIEGRMKGTVQDRKTLFISNIVDFLHFN
ncbi:polysaccharide pyruvyl transferase family protein [uncultured Bacteroides sp.]|uniref:polysaccharide pyruvyl transferase family protein n=1 Tax=uncultured Bacteroides sp. TaxID=162156 RepID=UPI002AABB3F8|nr:polysaccharide pyruvyl transferase family protein [uncultured Bacteroides sp.]